MPFFVIFISEPFLAAYLFCSCSWETWYPKDGPLWNTPCLKLLGHELLLPKFDDWGGCAVTEFLLTLYLSGDVSCRVNYVGYVVGTDYFLSGEQLVDFC